MPITIVMPVKDRADIVGATLRCLAEQTARPLRVVLVDNASTDGTREVLMRWAQEHRAPDFEVVVVDEPTPGGAAARNRGLLEVTTDWVMFFDSDDLMAPDHVERIMQTISDFPDADVIGRDVTIVSARGKRRRRPFEVRNAQYHNLFHSTLATQRYAARTELVRRAGAWNDTIGLWDDIELGARILAQSPNLKRINAQPSVEVYERENSITGSLDTSLQRMGGALRAMAQTLGPRWHHALALKATLQAAQVARIRHDDARRVMQEILRGVDNRLTRGALTFAYHYTRLGLPGAARLLMPLFKPSKS